MHQIYQQEENILSKLNSLLAMYRCLHFCSYAAFSQSFP